MRIPLPAVSAGALVAAVGAAGLTRGAVPPATPTGGTTTASAPIVVSNAYVRQPAPGTDSAGAYFTVYNTTAKPDQLQSVSTGAGAVAVVYATVGGVVRAGVQAVVPARGGLVLASGKGEVLIEQLFDKLLPGQTVNLELTFVNAGPIDITAPVIARGAPAPNGSVSPAPSSSGATK
jgi:copper(I)-binding protein